MAIELYDAVNGDGLFQLQGKAFKAQRDLDTSRGTTIPASVVAVFDQFEKLTTTLDLAGTLNGLQSSTVGWQSSGTSLASSLQTYVQNILIEMANADTPLAAKNVLNALNLLIAQMIANSQSVDQCTVSIAVTAGSSNNGDGKILTSTKRGDGLIQQNALAETITGTVTNDTSPDSAQVSLVGQAAAALLSQTWPDGSGVNTALTAVAPDASLLTNGDFETEADQPNKPDGWVVSVGTIGTTVLMTVVEVQTVAISGTPTSGYYTITFTNKAGKVQTTAPIAFDATSDAVQSALRLLEGLEQVTVSATGTTPNYTHTVTFTGYGGDITQLTSTSYLDTGSITHGTTTAGTAQVYSGGKAVYFASDGSQLTTLNQRIDGLTALTAYVVSLWSIADSAPAAGVITIDLVDGIGGTVINDNKGVANSLTFNASDLTTSWKHLSQLVSGECFFRMPTVVPPLVYLRIRISTAVTNTRKVFFDRASLVQATEIYRGGPLMAVFSGATPFVKLDTWSIVVANNYAGLIQGSYQRNFNMNSLGLLLPYSGSPTIPDSVMT